ncbi:MAG: hypothetical protein DHS20C16_34710 [Phycisphaerae bacterium]|nr:MAG: hypothetical protein DHS20C16_34710 [Phycisphaerae bacterium]
MSFFDGILLASCVLDFAVFATLLWLAAKHASTRGTKVVGAGMLLIVLGSAVGIVAAKTVAFAALGLNIFGLIHLLYLDAAVVAPAVGVLILASRFWRIPGVGSVSFGWAGTIASVCSFLLVPLCVYTSFVEPFNLQVETSTVEVPGLSATENPITVAVLADLQFAEVTAHEHRAVDLAMEAQPDLILIPGDVFQGTEREYHVQEAAIKALLGRLDAPGGVFVVSGDCDRISTLMEAIEGSKVQFIDGRIKQVAVRGTNIAVAGIPINYVSALAADTFRQVPTVAERSDVTIVLAHRPGVTLLPHVPDGIDLIVAGHTHGGQIQIPWFGPPITASPVPRKVAAGGLSRLNNQTVYVSRGVGCERVHAPRIRFCCPPEVSILTITGSPRRETLQHHDVGTD